MLLGVQSDIYLSSQRSISRLFLYRLHATKNKMI